jgi:hypothetical protein
MTYTLIPLYLRRVVKRPVPCVRHIESRQAIDTTDYQSNPSSIFPCKMQAQSF